jgi:hypothetical protein
MCAISMITIIIHLLVQPGFRCANAKKWPAPSDRASVCRREGFEAQAHKSISSELFERLPLWAEEQVRLASTIAAAKARHHR